MYLRLSALYFLFVLLLPCESWGKRDKRWLLELRDPSLDRVYLKDRSLRMGKVIEIRADLIVLKKRTQLLGIPCTFIKKVKWSSQRTKSSLTSLRKGFYKRQTETSYCARIAYSARFPRFAFGASLTPQGAYYTAQKHWFLPVSLQLAFQFFPINSHVAFNFLIDIVLSTGDSGMMLSFALGGGALFFFGSGTVRFFLHPGVMAAGVTIYTMKEYLSGFPLRPFLEAGLDIRLHQRLSLRVALRPQVEFVMPHFSIPFFYGGLSFGIHTYN